MTSVVYFIQAASGPIKIGWTADLVRRLQNIQSGQAEPVQVRATLPGDASLEAHFHELFAEHRQSGEWFSASQDVLNLIEAVRSGSYQPPIGYEAAGRCARSFSLDRARTAAKEEARKLIGTIAGPAAMGDKVKAGLARAASATGIGERRVRAMWHREAKQISAEEMDRLRAIAARVALPEYSRPLRALKIPPHLGGQIEAAGEVLRRAHLSADDG